MHKSIVFALTISLGLLLAGCSQNENDVSNQVTEVNENTTWIVVSSEDTLPVEVKDNIVTPDILEELNILYNAKLTLSNIQKQWNFIVATANDWTNEPDSGTQVVVAKINGKRLKLYEWNSWEISCTLHEKYDFPTELLKDCTSWADYTIPKESLPFAK